MQLTCPSCQLACIFPAVFSRFFDMPIRCQACQQSFTHNPAHQLTRRGEALTVLFAAVIFALSVLALDHYQLISLAQLEAWQWLVDITGRIGARLNGIELG